MSITTTVHRNDYTGNGNISTYAFNFKVFDKAHLLVIVTPVNGSSQILNVDTQYSVSGVGRASGGSITLLGGALGVGARLAIIRHLPLIQPTDLRNAGGYFPEDVEDQLDRLLMIDLQQQDQIDRSLKVPRSTDLATVSTLLPLPEANKVLGWDETEKKIVNRSPSDLVTVAGFSNWRTDLFSGTGSQTAFVLAADPGSVNNMDVSVDGITMTPGVDFSVSGTTLNFLSGAPPSGTDNICVRYGQALPQDALRTELTASTGSSLLGFIQSGTGAVARTVQARGREDIRATDFSGVDPTGASDSTTGLQNFLNACAGKTGRIPSGTYRINRNLVIASNTRLVGDGDSTVIQANPTYIGTNGGSYATQTCQMIQNTNFAASSLTDSDITIESITFDWGAVTIVGGGAHAISLRYVDRVMIRNCRSINGENLTALLACRDTHTENCHAVNAGNCAFDHWDGAGTARVIGCTVRNSGSSAQGVQFTGTGSFNENRTAFDCFVTGCSFYGIRTAGTAAAIISNANDADSSTYRFRSIGNYVENCDIGLVFEGDGGQHLSLGDTFNNVTFLPVFLQTGNGDSPDHCRVLYPHLIDCDHDSGSVALISISGTNHSVRGVRVTNTAAVAYQLIAWLAPGSSSCFLEIESGASGTGGDRIQNDGSGHTIIDGWEEVAALETGWTAYTPTVTATVGTFTSVSATGRFKQIGKTVLFRLRVSITTNGTAAGTLLATLPATAQTANGFMGMGREQTTGTFLVWFNATATQAYILTSGGGYPGANGRTLDISGAYEAQ